MLFGRCGVDRAVSLNADRSVKRHARTTLDVVVARAFLFACCLDDVYTIVFICCVDVLRMRPILTVYLLFIVVSMCRGCWQVRWRVV